MVLLMLSFMNCKLLNKAEKEFLESIPLGRAGEASDIANAIGFLLSREAAFVCGSLLYVDGGHDAMFRPDVI